MFTFFSFHGIIYMKIDKEGINIMKYYIRINGYEDVQCATRDLVLFIGRKLKEAHPNDEVVAYKDGEVLMTF